MAIEIRNRWTGEVICEGETIKKAVRENLSDLTGANLARAYLARANLGGAYLGCADLTGANLAMADLAGANLARANLVGAKLVGANLVDANLVGANLTGANFTGAKISWQSHDLLSLILKRAAGGDVEKLKVAGLILVCREKCWRQFLSLGDPLTDWAIGELRKWIVEGDNHPEFLDRKESPC